MRRHTALNGLDKKEKQFKEAKRRKWNESVENKLDPINYQR